MSNHRFNLLTLQELIDVLHVSRSTIDRWRKHKGLPFIKIGKEIFFDKEKVEDWIHSQETVIDTEKNKSASHETKTIKIGYQSKTAHMWSPLIIKKLGLLEEELQDINPSRKNDVEWCNATNGLELVEGMIAGNIHIASLGDYPIILSNQLSKIFPNYHPVLLGFDGKTAQSKGISIVLPKGVGYQEIGDLTGGTISTVMNSSAGYRLNRLLAGREHADVEIVHQDMNLSFQSIMEKGVGASVMWEPYVSLLQTQGANCITFEDADDYLTGLVTQDHWAQMNEDVVIAYMKAHLRAHHIAQKYPLRVAKIVSKCTDIDFQIAVKIISNVRWDAAVYRKDLQTLQNLSQYNSRGINLNGENTFKDRFRGYYLGEASKRMNLSRCVENPLEGSWDTEILY
ncbi:helix-turn-helix domain-containing protein [Aquibacillus albus]|nr:helix-turn-helix domain-containing protein [Aquibacillus albus]